MRALLTKAARMWDNGSVRRHSCLSIFEKVDRDFLKKGLTYNFVGGNAIQQEKVKAAVQGWVSSSLGLSLVLRRERSRPHQRQQDHDGSWYI
jgi:hypothetical protein